MTNPAASAAGSRPGPQGAYRFGLGSVDLARREWRVRGSVKPLEPKVFDVLCFLVQRHGTVVTREELLARFWDADAASDSALSRVVMKLRHALQGSLKEGETLRTIYRVGYRLDVGQVVHDAAGPLSDGSASLELVLAPWRVDGAGPGGEWAERALATLLTRELGKRPGISLQRAHSGLAWAWPAAPAFPGDSADAADVADVADADAPGWDLPAEAPCQLCGTLAWRDGRWCAHFGGLVGKRVLLEAQCQSPTLPELAQDVAARIAQWAAQPRSERSAGRPLGAGDRAWFVTDALYDDPMPQAHLFMARSATPGSLATQVMEVCARALADVADRARWDEAVQALQRAGAQGLQGLAACGCYALAHARLHRVGPSPAVDRCLLDAKRLAELAGDAALSFSAEVTMANVQMKRGQVSQARARYEQLLSAPDATRHPMQCAKLLNNMGNSDLLAGNLIGALSRFERGARWCRQHGLEPMMLVVSANLAMTRLDLGCLDDAVHTLDGMVELLPRVQSPLLGWDIALTACRVYVEALARPPLEALRLSLATWPQPVDGAERILCLLIDGLHHAACGAPAQAAALIRQAAHLNLRNEDRLRAADSMGWWLRSALRADDGDSLREAFAAAQALLAGDSIDPGLSGAVAHAEAARCHVPQQPQEARQRLLALIDRLPAGRLAFRVRLDAAWLCAELGEPDAGRQLLRELPQWLAEHPLGWKVQARLLAAEGDASAALWQQRLVHRLGDWAHDFEHVLLRAYRKAGVRRRSFPASPKLPSLLMPSL